MWAARAEFEAALDSETLDVILSDFRLPRFTGLEALACVRKEYPDAPFILLSGTIGEHAAIESLKPRDSITCSNTIRNGWLRRSAGPRSRPNVPSNRWKRNWSAGKSIFARSRKTRWISFAF